MALAQLAIVIGSDVGGAISGINTVKSSLGGLSTSGGKSLGQLGGDMQKLGGQITRATAPLAVGFGAGIKMASDFENSMAEIQARTGETPENMKRISDFALQMGADTSFSAGQAADAFLQLLSSGQSAEQAFQSLPAILDAAAASGEDLGATADTITDIMASFGIEVKTFEDGSTTVEGVANALARAAGASSASMADLGQGFANVGGVASNFGLDVTDTAAVLAIFSENGIKGAEAGTQLKSMLLNMSADTDKVRGAWNRLGTSMYDAEGNMRPLENIIYDIDTAMDDMSVEEQNRLMKQLGGSYGIMGLTALRGSISITDMKNAMSEQADVSDVAAARMDTFSGRVDSLMGSVETLSITALTPFMNDVLKPMAEELTKVVNSVTDWAAENPGLTSGIVGVMAVAIIAGPALFALGTFARGASAGFGVLKSAVGGANTLLGKLGVSGFAGAAGLAVVIAAAATDWEGVENGIKGWAEGMDDLANAKTPYEQTQALKDIDAAAGSIVAATGPGQWADGLLEGFEKISGQEVPDVATGISAWGDTIRMAGQILGIAFDDIKVGFQTFADGIMFQALNWIADFRGRILTATGGRVDISPDIETARAEVQTRIVARELAHQARAELLNQVGEGDIDLFEAFNWTASDGSSGTTTLMTAMVEGWLAPDVVANMGERGKLAIEQALGVAFAGADVESLSALLPIAAQLGIDTTTLMQGTDFEAQLATALALGDWATVEAIIPLLPQVEIDDPAVRQQILEGMALATQTGDEFFISFFAPLAAEVGIDDADVQAQIFSQIIAAAAGTVSASVGVQVTAAVTNASGIFQSVMAQVNAAIAGTPVGNALGAIGNAIGNIGATIMPPGSIPTGAAGTPMVLESGLMMVHEGERLLTAAETRAYHSGAMAGGGGGGSPMIFAPTIIGQRPHEVVGMLGRAARNGARNSRRV